MKFKKKPRGINRYSNEISQLVGGPNKEDGNGSNANKERQKTRKELRKDKRKLKKTKKRAFYFKEMMPDKQVLVTEQPMKGKIQDLKESAGSEKKANKRKKKIKTKEDGYVSKVEFIRKKQQLQGIKEDEKEIKFFEKQLKMNKRKSKKLPQSFVNDGLDYLLDFCDSENRENLNEPELDNADSEFQDDIFEVLGQKEISLSKQNLCEIYSEDNESSIVRNSVQNSKIKRVKFADEIEEDFVEQEENDDNIVSSDENDNSSGDFDSESSNDLEKFAQSSSIKTDTREVLNKKNFNMSVAESDKESDAAAEFSDDENLATDNSDVNSENSYDSDNISSSGDVEGDDHLSKKAGSKNSVENGYWEDIYGRMRDANGNVITECQNPGKYIPPAQRLFSANVDEKKRQTLERIKRQLKGLLNRLSESNMKSISSQIEDLYMNNSRHDMNETLTDLLIQSCVSPALTPERLVSEHAMLVAILHANIGTEVGAFVLQTIADRFNNLLSQNENYGEGKECDNLLHLLAQIYNFKLIHCTLICDIIKKLGEIFKEKDLDLILMLLKSVGFTLRKDNPLLLKEVISELQAKAVTVATMEDQSRVRFMLDILLAIKNNNMQKIPNYDPSRIEHLRKMARTMIRKGSFISELRVSLIDLLDVHERGRWWIVGSAWSGQLNNVDETRKAKEQDNERKQSVLQESISEEILELAHQQRMNTETRKNIFSIIMSAEDYVDAFNKLLRLGLKNQQEREIIFVSVDCCLQEKKFNPYYAYIIEKLCTYDRKFLMTTQCTIWDKLKESNLLSKIHWSNLAQLLSKLILKKSLSISVLKVIEFSDLNKKLVRFLRQILLSILLHEHETSCQEVFQRVALSPKLHTFRESLRLFIFHFVLRNKETLTSEDLVNKLEYRCQLADTALLAAEAKTKL